MNQLLECIPNISEGKDQGIIESISDSISKTKGVYLLNIDSGKAANRTVYTFAGKPEAVIEAAFRMTQTAAGLIDMRNHSGAHPRTGAVDVIPLVPVREISMAETVNLSYILAGRIGEELKIPVYCYEYSAFSAFRKKLENCRAGGYEGLEKKISEPFGKPDFGPSVFNARSGASIIGARNLLLAYNINLNTASAKLANAIASEIRESGKIVSDSAGQKVRVAGSLKSVKALGWFIQEYGFAQISANLTDLKETPVHVVFEEAKKVAGKYSVKVTGSEIIGLVPLQALTEAGKYYNHEKNRTEEFYINIAVEHLGLNRIYPFLPYEKILEYKLREAAEI